MRVPGSKILKFPAKTAGVLGLSLAAYGAYEAERALGPASEAERALTKWWAWYGRSCLGVYGVEVTRGGTFPSEGAYPGRDARGKGRMFVMNHRSALDVLLSFGHVEATLVSRADLAKWPVVGTLARRIGVHFVDRASATSGAAVVGAMIQSLERGRGVLVYPEGTTFAGDEVRTFRAGAFHAAKRAGAEVVPLGVAWAGDELSFGDEGMGAHMSRVSALSRVRVGLVAGAPVSAAGRDVAELTREAHDEVQRLVTAARGLVGA